MKIYAFQNNYCQPIKFKSNENANKKDDLNQKVYKLPELDEDKKLAAKIIGGAILVGGVCYAGYKGVLGKSIQKIFRGKDLENVDDVKKVVTSANIFERMGVKISQEEMNQYNKFKEDVDSLCNKKLPINDFEDRIENLLINNNIDIEIPIEKWSKKSLAYMDYSCTKFYDNYYYDILAENHFSHFQKQRLKVQIGVKDYEGAERTGTDLVLSSIDMEASIEGLELLNKMAAEMGEPKRYAPMFNVFSNVYIESYKKWHSPERELMTNYEIKCAEALSRLEELFAPVYGDDNKGIKAIRECLNK